MFCRTRSLPPLEEDPAVAQVERILQEAARDPAVVHPVRERRVATHALWICACVTTEGAPTWLIYDTDGQGIAWCRVPRRVEPLDLVEARFTGGGHAVPGEVLLWLQGQAPDPWAGGGGGSADTGVLDELRRKIQRR